MPNEPFAKEPLPDAASAGSDILAGVPDEAGYDAVHAALAASEHGRRFLNEFAERHRQADTTMVVGAIARVEAAIRGEAPMQASARAGELFEIAAALERIKVAIQSGTAPVSTVAVAVERLQDLAFMLRERPTETTLLDALDAAVRELADAASGAQSTPPGAHEAIALVDALASRVREMIDAHRADHGTDRPATDIFDLTADAGDGLARAVAVFAASLPALAAASQSMSDAAEQSEPSSRDPASGEGAPALSAVSMPLSDVAPSAGAAETTDAAAADADVASTPQPAAALSESAAILSQAFSDDHFSSASRDEAAAAASSPEPTASAEPPGEAEAPAHASSTDVVVGPQEDPDDLFEPQPAPSEPAAAAMAAAAAEPPARAAPPPEAARVPPPPPRAIPRPPLSDPLAAVRDLSEEELIALFS